MQGLGQGAATYFTPDTSTSARAASNGPVSGFLGPFEGMGITGYNDLGSFAVEDPRDCASRCSATPDCRSFDYGARGKVLGECWLSTATRESAPSAYSSWQLYDYYEVQA